MNTEEIKMDYYENIMGTIGNTPLVKLNSICRDLPCTILAKVEFFNPGGSVKDRIGEQIIDDAEEKGLLKPGGTIIESTSGNTGVGLAIAAAIRGYKTIFVMPDKMSQEKISLLRAFGARVVVTPTAVEPEDPRSYYSVAKRLVQETPNSVLANQYHNPMNPHSHYVSTGPEIWNQTRGRVTHFVTGIGTGGTISGTAKYLKEKNSNVQIVGVDPIGSILYELHRTGEYTKAESYKTEGIGEDFLPTTMNLDIIDTIVQVNDKDSLLMTRRLVREEGIFCGGSCGSAVVGAIKYARDHKLGKDDVVVVILPDSGSRYLSKIFNDDWMRENGFLENSWVQFRVADIQLEKSNSDQAELITAKSTDLMHDVINLMKKHNISQVPVLEDEQLVGVVTEIELLKHMLSSDHKHEATETIASVINTNVLTVRANTLLETLMDIFNNNNVAIILEGNKPTGILTKIDMLDFLASRIV